VTLYPEQVNHGFGRGNNLVLHALAARPAPPDKVFLLNPDARLENETIAILADVLDQTPGTAIAGCSIQRPLSGHSAIAAFRFPNIVAEFTNALCVGLVERLLQRFSVARTDLAVSEKVDWVSGAGLLARFDVLVEMGFFNPDYFLYFEEVDLMYRIHASGRDIRYVPEARIIHVAGAATGMNSAASARRRRPSYWYESWRTYFSSNHGRVYAFGCVSLRLCGWTLNYVLRRLQFRRPDSPKGFMVDGLRYALLPLFLTASRK
jgi:GT2 family glycosyltransferase